MTLNRLSESNPIAPSRQSRTGGMSAFVASAASTPTHLPFHVTGSKVQVDGSKGSSSEALPSARNNSRYFPMTFSLYSMSPRQTNSVSRQDISSTPRTSCRRGAGRVVLSVNLIFHAATFTKVPHSRTRCRATKGPRGWRALSPSPTFSSTHRTSRELPRILRADPAPVTAPSRGHVRLPKNAPTNPDRSHRASRRASSTHRPVPLPLNSRPHRTGSNPPRRRRGNR